MSKVVTSIEYKDDHNMLQFFSVGLGDVVEIAEHSARGEGDKWYYDVKFKKGDIIRLFSFDLVRYKENDKEDF